MWKICSDVYEYVLRTFFADKIYYLGLRVYLYSSTFLKLNSNRRQFRAGKVLDTRLYTDFDLNILFCIEQVVSEIET